MTMSNCNPDPSPDPTPGLVPSQSHGHHDQPSMPQTVPATKAPAANAQRYTFTDDDDDDDDAAATLADALTQVWAAHTTLTCLIKSSPAQAHALPSGNPSVDRDQAVRALDAIHLLLETVVTPHILAVAGAALGGTAANGDDVDVKTVVEQQQGQVDQTLNKVESKPLVNAKIQQEDQQEPVVVATTNKSSTDTSKQAHTVFAGDDDHAVRLAASPEIESPAESHHHHVAPAAVEAAESQTDQDNAQRPATRAETSHASVTVPPPTPATPADHVHDTVQLVEEDPLSRKRSTKLRRSSTRRRNSDVRRTLVMMDLSLDRHLANVETLDDKDRHRQASATEQQVSALEKLVGATTKVAAASPADDGDAADAKPGDATKPETVEDDPATDHSGYLHILDPTDEYDLDDSIALAPPTTILDSPPPLPVTALSSDPAPAVAQAPPSPASTAHNLDPSPPPMASAPSSAAPLDHADDDGRPPTQPHSPPSSPDPTHPPLHHLSDTGAPRPLSSTLTHSPDLPSASIESLASPHHSETAVDEARAVVTEYAAAATRSVMLRAEHEATLVAAAAMSGQGRDRDEKRRSLVASVASTVSPRHSVVGAAAPGAAPGMVRGNHPPPMMSSASMPSMYPLATIPTETANEQSPLPRLTRASTAPADPALAASATPAAVAAACPPSASPPTKSVGFSSTVSVVSPPADSPPNPTLAAAKSQSSSGSGGAKRAMHALRKAIQSATNTAARHRSRSTSPGKNAGAAARTPYPDHPHPLPAGAVDLTRNESTLSRRIHEADANMLKNAHIIAMAARAEEERQRQRHEQQDVWQAEPSGLSPPQPKRRSSAGTAPAAPAVEPTMPAKQAMDMLAGATPAAAAPSAPDRFLPPSVAEQQRWSRSTISVNEKQAPASATAPSAAAAANTDRTLAPIPARSVSGASTTSSGPMPSRSLSRSSSSSSAASTDSLPELWPLVELSLDRQASLRHRAHLLITHIGRDAIGYYASNEPREKWAHAPACHAAFLARHAAPTIQMLHQAGMKVTLAQLVHALGWVAQGKGRGKERMPPAPALPEVPTPDVLQHVQRTLLGFVASFTDVGAHEPATAQGVAPGGMPASIKVAGLATALFASPVVHAAASRFATPHPVVFRMLDRITALLVLARLTGLALLYPVPGAPFAGDAMVRAVPKGTRVPTSEMLRVAGAAHQGEDEEEGAGVDVEEPVPAECEVPEGFKVDDGLRDEEENVAVGLMVKRQRAEDGQDRVGMLVFPGLVDAQGRVVNKAWVLVE